MILRDPVAVWEVDGVAHDSVARLVVHLARRTLDRLKNDVLVETGGHPLGKLDPIGPAETTR